MTWFCEFVLDMWRQVCGSGLEIAEVQGGGHSAATLRLCARHRALRNLLVQHGKCQQCMVKEGLTWRLSCWRDEVRKNASAGDYRNADRCKSYSDSRQCWRNTSVHGHVACLVAERAIRWMTCVCGCRVCMICAFCISAAVLRAVFSCIVTVYALWCSQKIESDSRDSACEPAPSRCYAPRSHMHTGASAHATQPGRRLHRRD